MKKFTFKTNLLLALFFLWGSGIKAETYYVDFESLTKTSYSSGTVTLGAYDWNFTGACAGNQTNDWKVGSVSARLAGTTKATSNSETSKIEMLSNKTGGIGNISFQYRRYGTDEQIPWLVQWSSDGNTWTTIQEITGTGEVQTFSYDLNQDNARIRIIANGFITSDTNGKRLNVDELILTDNSGTPVPTITVTETTLEGFSYEVGKGPSAEKSFQVSGSNLTGNITLTPSDNLEISTGTGENFVATSPINLPPTEGVVAATSIYARLKAGLPAGNYTETITANSTGAVTKTITCKGNVFEPVGAIPDVIITEVYGGGGNSGAELKNDFIELYNTTNTPVNIAGWSLQYYAATGTGKAADANVFVIPDGKSIPAYTHFLIQCAAGAGGTQDLPTPDATCELTLGGTAGKVILYTTSEPQSITTTDITSITGNPYFKDYVPYGTTAVPVWGTAMSSNISNTTSAARKISSDATPRVYQYTGNIGSDFEVATPTPQNTLWTAGIKNVFENLNAYVANGKIHIKATTVGEQIEVYNTLGQRLISVLSTGEENIISVNAKGVILVKCGNKVGKVIL